MKNFTGDNATPEEQNLLLDVKYYILNAALGDEDYHIGRLLTRLRQWRAAGKHDGYLEGYPDGVHRRELTQRVDEVKAVLTAVGGEAEDE